MEIKQISEGSKYQKGIYKFLYDTYWYSLKEKILTIVGIVLIIFFAIYHKIVLIFLSVYISVMFYFKFSWWWASYEKTKTQAFNQKVKNVSNK